MASAIFFASPIMALVPAIFLCFLLPFHTLLSSTAAQTRANISLGSSLTADDNNMSWESPSGDFAFGFRQIGKDGFLLAIWYSQIPNKTIVWSANGNNLVQRGSKVQLTEVGLVLRDAEGDKIWEKEITSPGVAYGAMLDTGNFVLAHQTSAHLWESFDDPTDTLLPAQTLAQGRKLAARYSETNYSSGRFHLEMQTDGNLVLYILAAPAFAYWNTDTVGSGFAVIFNQSGFIYLQAKNRTILYMLPTPASSTQDFYQRAVLDHDGVFQQYVHPKRNDSSSGGRNMEWSRSSEAIPDNICTRIVYEGGRGLCGLNGYCTLRVDQRPNCKCPKGYSLLDPNDAKKGCKQSFEAQSCDNNSRDADSFFLYPMENTNFPHNDIDRFDQVTEDWCRKECLRDCNCAVATFQDSTCWKKRTPLAFGVKDPSIKDKALMKMRKDNSTSNPGGIGTSSRKKDNSALLLIRSMLLGSSVFFNIILLAACGVLFFKRKAQRFPEISLLIIFSCIRIFLFLLLFHFKEL